MAPAIRCFATASIIDRLRPVAQQRLERSDTRAARVLELHYFAGLTAEQCVATLGMARSSIDRDLRFAKAFLKSEIGRDA